MFTVCVKDRASLQLSRAPGAQVRKIAKSGYYLRHLYPVCPSGRPHVTTRLPSGRIFMKFDIRAFFENLWRKFKFNWNLTRITVLYMKTNVHISYLAKFFLEWEMCLIKVVEMKHFLSSSVSRKLCRLWDNVEKYGRAWQSTDEIWRMRIAFWVPKATDTHSEYVIHIDFLYNNGYVNAPQCSLPLL
jgi:hypothetical protein